MELHNTVEDTVIARVNEIFDELKTKENPYRYCTCQQCRMDIICYALNRMRPQYIVSHRGASRVKWESIERQQQVADITTLVHEGLKQVNHNRRPNFAHSADAEDELEKEKLPVFNIPAIMGRIFNGENFAPLSGVDVELLRNGEMVPMKDANWQNPCRIVSHTDGNFSFWPAPVTAPHGNEHKIFEYSLRVSAPDFETLIHFFKIPVASEVEPAGSFALDRTFKLPDLYMFPPGEAEKNG